MTLGIGSPGFDPFYCPPCPAGSVCNVMCIDVLDGPILVTGTLLLGVVGGVAYNAVQTERGV